MNYGLINTFYPDVNIKCADDKCTRYVNFMDKCFIDTQDESVYCESCGQCLRYARKMAKKRNNQGD
jgi:hypothetical protein